MNIQLNNEQTVKNQVTYKLIISTIAAPRMQLQFISIRIWKSVDNYYYVWYIVLIRNYITFIRY